MIAMYDAYTSSMQTITIYTTPTCGFCHMAKQYLTGKNIAYKEIDVTSDVEGMNWVLNKTGQMGVPVLSIGESTIIGFDRPEIDAALLALKS